MTRHSIAAFLLVASFLAPRANALAAVPAETIDSSEQVLAELVAIPGRQIPAALLAEAQGVAIIPRVIKIGFVAGVRRGNGVVLVRDAEGGWSLPRFVRLTGGSVGWQAGVQGTDVVLVFRTRRSVENLLKGKFTIGVDAAAAAGPVGRNAAAATDPSLNAEILSYSRSRGLFLGASIDGSAIEMDNESNAAFYGSTDPEIPQSVPIAATKLQAYVLELTGGAALAAVAGVAPTVVADPAAPGSVVPSANVSSVRAEALRRSLVAESTRLSLLLNPEWQAFLGLPPEVQDPAQRSNPTNLALACARFEQVSKEPQYASLAARPEFQTTWELLREYTTVVGSTGNTLQLPAPPAVGDPRR